MSVVIQVFLAGERMPTPEQWAEALRAHGFDMDLDTDFDIRAFSGFLPCKYKGHDAGFEYYFEAAGPVVESDDRLREAIAGRDSVVSFVTHSDFGELMTSVIASGFCVPSATASCSTTSSPSQALPLRGQATASVPFWGN